METYEQQYSSITADIVAHTGKIIKLSGFEKQQVIKTVENLLEDAKKVLEHMRHETANLPSKQQEKYTTRLQSYQSELVKLEKELLSIRNRKARVAFSDEVLVREELLSLEDIHSGEDDQSARLLDSTDEHELLGQPKERTYKTPLAAGDEFDIPELEELNGQRNVLQKARDRLKEVRTDFSRRSQILSERVLRITPNRIVPMMALILVILTGVALYVVIRRHL